MTKRSPPAGAVCAVTRARARPAQLQVEDAARFPEEPAEILGAPEVQLERLRRGGHVAIRQAGEAAIERREDIEGRGRILVA